MRKQRRNEHRIQFLHNNVSVFANFANTMVPTLLHVFSYSMDNTVQENGLLVLLKILYFANAAILEDALLNVRFPSFLSRILSSQEFTPLSIGALYAADLLVSKLPGKYIEVFHKDGVISEILRIAENPDSEEEESTSMATDSSNIEPEKLNNPTGIQLSSADESALKALFAALNDAASDEASIQDRNRGTDRPGPSGSSTIDDLRLSMLDKLQKVLGNSGVMSEGSGAGNTWNTRKNGNILKKAAVKLAKQFQEEYCTGKNTFYEKSSSSARLTDLGRLASELIGNCDATTATLIMSRIAGLFEDFETGISSFELMYSGLGDAILKFLTQTSDGMDQNQRARIFTEAFSTKLSSQRPTALSTLVSKLQEALDKEEKFHVIRAFGTTEDDARRVPGASSIIRHVRLNLSPEPGTDIPPTFRTFTVSMHAVALFDVLEEYLRPKLCGTPSSFLNMAVSSLEQQAAARKVDAGVGSSNATAISLTSATLPESTAMGKKAAESIPEDVATSPSTTAMDLDEERRQSLSNQMDITNSPILPSMQADDAPPADLPSPLRETESSKPASASSPANPTEAAKAAKSKIVSYSDTVKNDEWYLEFTLEGKPVSLRSTVYAAIHKLEADKPNSASEGRSAWGSSYNCTYRRVLGPKPSLKTMLQDDQAEISQQEPATDNASLACRLPEYFKRNSKVSSCPCCCFFEPCIFSTMDAMNFAVRYVMGISFHGDLTDIDTLFKPLFPNKLDPSEFINKKLKAKLGRQLEEALVVIR